MKGRTTRAHVLILAVLVLATYGASCRGDFVSDDTNGVRDNEAIRSFDGPHVARLLTTFFDASYMPVTALSLALDYRLWGAQPAGYHATNVALHLLCALLIYAVLKRLALPPLAALAVAGLWAVHPVQVESVAWISERKNVLSGVFFFAALHGYLRVSDAPRVRDYLAVLALFVLAVLSKMNTVVLPAVCLAYEVTCRFRFRRRDVLLSLPLFGIGALVAWYNVAGSTIHGGPYHGGSALVTWLSSTVVVFRYLGKLLLPVHLAPYYDVVLHGSLLDPAVLLSTLGILGAVGAAIFLAVRKRREGFWVLWFFLTLAPMLNLVPFRSMMQDRYLYLASLGPIAALATALASLRPGLAARRVLLAVVAVAILGSVALSRAQVAVWSDSLSFYEALATELVLTPEHPPYATPDREQRIAFLEDRAKRQPSAVVLSNLGSLHYTAGRNDEAVALLERAARLDPDHPRIRMILGFAYLHAHRVAEARAALERSVALGPYAEMAWSNLAIARLLDGDRAGATAAVESTARVLGSEDAARRWIGSQLSGYEQAWQGQRNR